MNEIDALEQRISVALKRIGTAAERMDAPAPVPVADAEELEGLKSALEEEKLVSAQHEERLKRLKGKFEDHREELEEKLEAQQMAVAKLDMEMQRMRAANEQLRKTNQALREANEKGVGEPHLINKAMLAELEGLRASREVDRAETAAIAETIGVALAGEWPNTGEGA